MADVKLNFSSQWPSIQVAKVIPNPATAGEAASFPYTRKFKHNLGYPPFAVGFKSNPLSTSIYGAMIGLDMDSTYVYLPDLGGATLDSIVIYALDVSNPVTYPVIPTAIGDVVKDTGSTDLRKFLLHSRAVSPMVLNVTTGGTFGVNGTVTYTSPLNYPTFSFGWVSANKFGLWQNAPLAGQSYPVMQTNGFTSTLQTLSSSNGFGGLALILTLRNPAIITTNTTSVTI